MAALERIGNCRIEEEVASGGMAVVYRAQQESLNRTVAVKALKSSVAADQQFTVRFEREALSLAQLQHENIIHVYDFFRERGAYFIVMEYVEGIDLYDLLERCGRLPVDVASIMAMQVARALDYAHYRGIIHRDIKPANIMVSRQGGVKLMDFGIARDPSFGDLTEAGTGLGTPSYMSPEQILGDRLDFRSDLFSLGIVLYQMVTGRKPFIEDEQKSVMHKIRLEKYPPPRRLNPDVPRELDRIMARCMNKDPRERWRSTQDLVLALERFLAKRVDMNYHARLVMYLKHQGILSQDEAEKYLRPMGTSGTQGFAIGQSFVSGHALARQQVKRVATVQGIITAVVALVVLLIHLAPVGASMSERSFFMSRAMSPDALSTMPRGHVKIVVDPWAHVYVDGVKRDTTPFARPLELIAGTRTLRLENEYYETLEKQIDVVQNSAEEPLVLRFRLEKQ